MVSGFSPLIILRVVHCIFFRAMAD